MSKQDQLTGQGITEERYIEILDLSHRDIEENDPLTFKPDSLRACELRDGLVDLVKMLNCASGEIARLKAQAVQADKDTIRLKALCAEYGVPAKLLMGEEGAAHNRATITIMTANQRSGLVGDLERIANSIRKGHHKNAETRLMDLCAALNRKETVQTRCNGCGDMFDKHELLEHEGQPICQPCVDKCNAAAPKTGDQPVNFNRPPGRPYPH